MKCSMIAKHWTLYKFEILGIAIATVYIASYLYGVYKCVDMYKLYNRGKSSLPDIYTQCPRAQAEGEGVYICIYTQAQGWGCIYQANYECSCYN